MPKKSKTSQQSFAEQYSELEKIVSEFEQSDVSIEEGLQKFERGLQIAASLRKTLTSVENSIEKLKAQYRASGKTQEEDEEQSDSTEE
jgi:exodeoxyribonuclease VII small subunit